MDGKRTLLHANHGIIVCTETVAEAFDYLYYLEKAGEITVKAMSTGRPLQLIPDNVCKMFHTDMEPPHLVKVHWYPHGHAAHLGHPNVHRPLCLLTAACTAQSFNVML